MCEEDLSNKEYYEELSSDPTKEYVNEIVNTIKDLRKEEMLTEKEEYLRKRPRPVSERVQSRGKRGRHGDP